MKNKPDSLFRYVFGLYVHFSQTLIIELFTGFCQVSHALNPMQRHINVEGAA